MLRHGGREGFIEKEVARRMSFVKDLTERGLIQQVTDAGLEPHLLAQSAQHPRRAYVGFDPTADSLTIGNLVGIMALARWQRAGHQPVALMGGGTGMVGDPSGKSAERSLQTMDQVAANVESIKKSFANVIDFESAGPTQGLMVNNAQWLAKLGFLEALREIGKYFSVNQMIQRDSVKSRLENRDSGLSYTEFSYMLLQAYDFAHLHQQMGVTVQMGGSDQWGNIVSGIDLIRRYAFARGEREGGQGEEASKSVQAYGVVWPLVTKADGGKFGKTESGAIWLSPHRTSPFAYYQFWLNTADADVERFLKVYTFASIDEIAGLMAEQGANPGGRPAQRALAQQATTILHGRDECARAIAASEALFSGRLSELSLDTLQEAFATVPTTQHDKTLLAGDGMGLADLLVQTSLVKSKTEARQFLSDGSIAVNGAKVSAEGRVKISDLLHGSIIALRRGKKNWHLTRWG